jgi:CCR4-NOT transcriptional regulation complex NOT5 subunit
MIYRRRVGLKKLGVVASTSSKSAEKRCGIEELLEEIQEYVKRDGSKGPDDGYSSDDDIADDAGGDCHVQSQSTSTPSSLAVYKQPSNKRLRSSILKSRRWRSK